MAIYLNTASCGLIEESEINESVALQKQFLVNGSNANQKWSEENYWKIKEQIAEFLHGNKYNVAYIPNMSYGINMIGQSLRGDEKILLFKEDFPSLNLPFENNNFDITYIETINGFEISLEEIEEILKTNTINILAISHVQYKTGFTIDIEALSILCKNYNTILIVDGTQSLGAIEINFEKNAPEIFIASNYKWMNAGYGTGILYMTDNFINTYPPIISGNHSNGLITEYPHAKILSFEPGHLNIVGLTIMSSALAKKLKVGIENIESKNKSLTSRLIHSLKDTSVKLIGNYDMENRSSIISIQNEIGLFEKLVEKEIIVTNRFGLLRISIHHHNTIEHIEKLILAIKDWENRN